MAKRKMVKKDKWLVFEPTHCRWVIVPQGDMIPLATWPNALKNPDLSEVTNLKGNQQPMRYWKLVNGKVELMSTSERTARDQSIADSVIVAGSHRWDQKHLVPKRDYRKLKNAGWLILGGSIAELLQSHWGELVKLWPF